MAYSDLTAWERHYWDEYETLRAITDWAGFTDAQANRKQAARDALVNQRKEIWRCAEGEKQCEGGKGWDVNNRAARYQQLSDDSLNNGQHKHEYTLPANGCTPTEKSYIEEREGYLMIGGDGRSADDAQADRKTANVDWLVSRRKQLYSLIQSSSSADNEANYRHQRYKNLSIATHYGDAWAKYEREHNKYGQEIHEPSGGGSSSRGKAVSRARSYLGVNENPAGSNRGNPQPDGWQKRVIGASGYPWCACFTTCMAWDAGVIGASSAGVQQIVNMARAGQGMFRGYTTNPGAVLRGDMAIVSCESCHVGMVVSSDDAYHTIEGNTSPGTEGSQYNGGCVAEKHRPRGDIIGWALVDYP